MKKKSKNLKIISATSAVIFSLLTCFTGVYAWFMSTAQTKSKSSEVGVQANPNLIDLSFAVYKYDLESKQGIKYAENDEAFNLSLNKFDNFVRERNINNNNVMRFNLSFPNKYIGEKKRNIKFNITCDTSVIGDDFDPGISDGKKRTHNDEVGYKYQSGDTTYVCNNISNVLYFKVLPYTYTADGVTHKFDETINIDETNDSQTYFDATEYFSNQDEKNCFVNNGSKETQLQIDIDEIAGNADSIVLYVEYNYDNDLMDQFLKPNEFKDSTTSEFFGVNINFYKDVLLFELTSEGGENE